MDDRLSDVIERAIKELDGDEPDARRNLTLATMAVAAAMVEVADEIRELRRAIYETSQ